ncbi:hypothetical protein FBZ84_10410 [Azospirillum baldaniorum]|uniref:FitA-like ribbon-helix-helix domain-containing protein n=1 Tax=Azospirillum baldaniorum TaxID=1064539 RepID=UPI0011A76EB4|nr:hypothetical protein [Azospirillum baldaniorum]TWA68365.1 hypothetical protein FBZ84_10410 [Azospirillum baldaniorum]
MGMITVRDIDDSVLKALTDRASAAGRSLEEEVRETLAQSVRRSHEDFWDRADRLRGERRFRQRCDFRRDAGRAVAADRRAMKLGQRPRSERS